METFHHRRGTSHSADVRWEIEASEGGDAYAICSGDAPWLGAAADLNLHQCYGDQLSFRT
jgi:hypothetical protein